ncbi:MAG: hypothetical protein IKP03_02715 [Fibrobacter sp.]|nr:hypothetical protein [Fibrobacter sp.]
MRCGVISLMVAMATFATGCSDNEVAGGASGDAGIIAISNKQIAGVAQKGPFVTGSNIVLKETSAEGNLVATGREFFATTRSDQGDFVIDDINLESQYVRLTATGYYKSETTKENSKCQVSLNALSDISDRGVININVFTHLEYGRTLYLVKEGKSFAEAQKQAHAELMKSFSYEWISEDSENLDVTDTSEAGKALERISSGLDLAMNDAQERAEEGVRCEAAQEVVDVLAKMFRKSGDFSGDFKTEYASSDVIMFFLVMMSYPE